MKTRTLGPGLAAAMTSATAAYAILGNIGAIDYWDAYFLPDVLGSFLGAALGALLLVVFVRPRRPAGPGFMAPLVAAVFAFFLVGSTFRVVAGITTYGDEMFAAFLPIVGTAWMAFYVFLIGGGILYAARRSSATTPQGARRLPGAPS